MTLPAKAGTHIETIHTELRHWAQMGIAKTKETANRNARTSGKASAPGEMSNTASGRSHQTAFAKTMLSKVLLDSTLPDESTIEGLEKV